MKAIIFAFLFVFFLPLICHAGKINGTLKKDGRLIGKGVVIEITCGDKLPFKAKINERSSFSIFIPQACKCIFEVPDYPGATFKILCNI